MKAIDESIDPELPYTACVYVRETPVGERIITVDTVDNRSDMLSDAMEIVRDTVDRNKCTTGQIGEVYIDENSYSVNLNKL